MRAKIWRANDPYRVAVWHGELEDAGEGKYQVPASATGILQANEQYDWIVYEGELPERAKTLPPDAPMHDEVQVHKFYLRTWQFRALVVLTVFFLTVGIVDVVANLVRWLF